MNDLVLMMFGINLVISYFIMSPVMIYSFQHIYNHLNKVYMSLLMSSFMGLVELWVMGSHIVNEKNAKFYYVFFCVIIIFSIIAIRQQLLIGDRQFLASMIEHHSAALLMAEKIVEKTDDPRLNQLANNIIQSQSHEIDLMSHWLQTSKA